MTKGILETEAGCGGKCFGIITVKAFQIQKHLKE